jgi:hypothetical protein
MKRRSPKLTRLSRRSSYKNVYVCKHLIFSSPVISVPHGKKRIKKLSVRSRRLRSGGERACIRVQYDMSRGRRFRSA